MECNNKRNVAQKTIIASLTVIFVNKISSTIIQFVNS